MAATTRKAQRRLEQEGLPRTSALSSDDRVVALTDLGRDLLDAHRYERDDRSQEPRAGELTLEESLAAHKRGLELAAFCQEKLASAEQQVKVLEGEVLKKFAEAAGADDDE